MSNDRDVSCVDVLVFLDEMGAQDRGEELGRCYGVLFGHDVGSVLHGICCNNRAVVGLCISATHEISIGHWIAEESDLRGLYLPLEKDTDRHLDDSLGLGFFVPVNLVNANVVFAIAAGLDFGWHTRQIGGGM